MRPATAGRLEDGSGCSAASFDLIEPVAKERGVGLLMARAEGSRATPVNLRAVRANLQQASAHCSWLLGAVPLQGQSRPNCGCDWANRPVFGEFDFGRNRPTEIEMRTRRGIFRAMRKIEILSKFEAPNGDSRTSEGTSRAYDMLREIQHLPCSPSCHDAAMSLPCRHTAMSLLLCCCHVSHLSLPLRCFADGKLLSLPSRCRCHAASPFGHIWPKLVCLFAAGWRSSRGQRKEESPRKIDMPN